MTDILDLSDEELRAQFHELTAQRDTILKKSEPLRTRRDKLVNEHRERELTINAEIKAAEEGLAQIDQRRARLVKLLGGGTGAPAPAEPEASDG